MVDPMVPSSLIGMYAQPLDLCLSMVNSEGRLAENLKRATRLERLTLCITWLPLALGPALQGLPHLRHLGLGTARVWPEAPRQVRVEGEALALMPPCLRELTMDLMGDLAGATAMPLACG